MAPDELLERLAAKCKREIGPAVAEEYPRTQAFMTAVVLEKLARQLRSAREHAAGERADRAALLVDVDRLLAGGCPHPLAAALDACRAEFTDERFSAFVEALWEGREALGAERFAALLARVRTTLRARLDRQMTYAS